MDVKSAIEILSKDYDFEELDKLQILFSQMLEEVKNILEQEESGVLNEDQANLALLNIFNKGYQEELDIVDIEISPVDIEKENQFSALIGTVLAGLIEQEYDDPQEAIADISEATGLSQEDVLNIINDLVVPDVSTADAIASVFDYLQEDEEAYKEWIDLISKAYSESVEPPPSNSSPEIATMRREHNALKADFSAFANQEALKTELKDLAKQADRLIESGKLTPSEKIRLLGQSDETDEAIAVFSSACAAMSVPEQVQIDRIQYYLHEANNRKPWAMFGEISTEGSVETPVDKEAVLYAEEYIRNNGLG